MGFNLLDKLLLTNGSQNRVKKAPHLGGVGLKGAPVSHGWLVSWETKMNPAECVKKKR